MDEIKGKIVKDNVAEPGPNDKAYYQSEKELIYYIYIYIKPFFSYLLCYQKMRGHETKDIHDPIPPYLKGAKFNYYWVYGWIAQH